MQQGGQTVATAQQQSCMTLLQWCDQDLSRKIFVSVLVECHRPLKCITK